MPYNLFQFQVSDSSQFEAVKWKMNGDQLGSDLVSNL